MMNEQGVRNFLQLAFDQAADADDDDYGWPEELQHCDTRSFEEAMVMTQDEGLVLTLEDGSEFYITIQKKR